jgi:mannose-6-phosphate isomerase
MTEALYPLAFEPIYQYRLWGGRRLANWLKAPLPGDGPIGEAWLLSDRDEHPSRVANGPLKGRTITQLMEQSRAEILGRLASRFRRFPLLLKFLDVREMLSVQVHPPDDKTDLIPPGDTGKTEAWVVLEAEPGSRIYAGLKPGTTAADLRSLSQKTVNDHLASFTPSPGQSILITAGIVHALGGGVMVFEVQENSDVTFRLYDWDHIDPKTGQARALQVDQALACIDVAQGAVEPVTPVVEATEPTMRERLVDCRHFRLWRLKATAPFTVGAPGTPSVVVCIDGAGQIEYEGADFGIGLGEVVLLPAAVGPCRFRPEPSVTLLETAVPGNP